MSRIEMTNLSHAYVSNPKDDDWVLRDINLNWQDGVSYALLGPSGCGKSTLLNIISGLVTPSHGNVLYDGEDVTNKDTRERNIAQVFQFPVLYDSMTVYDNLAFPLRNRGWDKSKIKHRVGEIADILDLASMLNKRASGLSADLKQIISLGRGLVRPDVSAILFDEPLTVIDPHLKWKLRCKLREIYERFKLTLIYVTHDQTEALTFADQVLVMKDGIILQQGSPEELHDKPAHAFVGYFIGSPGMNFLPCAFDNGNAVVGEHRIPVPDGKDIPSGSLQLGIRPESIILCEEGQGLPIAIEDVRDLGKHLEIRGLLGSHKIVIEADEDANVPQTGIVHVAFPRESCRLYADEVLVR